MPLPALRPSLRAALPPLAAALLAAPGLSQATLTRVDGALGSALQYSLQGGPAQGYFLVPSLNQGPTPLALIDPLDPRVLAVGLDLQPAWKAGLLNGAGQASVAYPLPLDPTLQGIAVHAQFVTLPGFPTFVDDVSNATGVALAQPSTSTFALGDLGASLGGHTATALADGRVLVAGGSATDGFGAPLAGTALYLFDPQTQAFATSAASLGGGRVGHSATRLADGRVLLLGGADAADVVTASGELYDPATDSVAPVAPMPQPRIGHTATLLADGRVLVVGGLAAGDFADPLAALSGVLASSVLYNPATNSWGGGPNLPAPRAGHSASRLADGRVLVTGGLAVPTLFGIPLPAVTTDCRYYNPGSNSFSAAPAFSGARLFHAQTTLPDGRVVVAGGVEGSIDLISLTVVANEIATVRVLPAGGGAWANAANLNEARGYAAVHAVSGGRVCVVGGLRDIDGATFSGNPATAIEVAPASLASFALASTVLAPRATPASAVVDGGQRVLSCGAGFDTPTQSLVPDTSAELFLP